MRMRNCGMDALCLWTTNPKTSVRTDIVGLYVYGQFTAKYTEKLAHAHAVDTRPSLRIIEGLGTRL